MLTDEREREHNTYMTTTNERLAEATANRNAARAAFNAATHGTKAWHAAADELDFWIGKVTALASLAVAEAGPCPDCGASLDEACR